jgi:predicted amidohydrolase
MVRVAGVQVETDEVETMADRIERVLEAVTDIAAGGTGGLDVCAADGVDVDRAPDVIVLPELWAVGAFDTATVVAHAGPVPGPVIDRLCDIAAASGVWIHAGAWPEALDEGRCANTSVVIDDTGMVAGRYRKLHLFGFDSGEAAALTAGTVPVVMETPLGTTGLTTCYDLRFPELFRALVDQGATAALVPAGWPAHRIEHWRVLARARAIENQFPVIAVNGVGEHAGVRLGGSSAVVDAWGEVVVEALPDRECLLLADVDPVMAERVRGSFPVLRDRRM